MNEESIVKTALEKESINNNDLFAGNVLAFEQFDGSIYFLLVSPPKVVEEILKLAELQPGEMLCDLGSGDGRIVIRATQRYEVRAIGIESHPDLVECTRRRIQDLGLESCCQVLAGDLYEVNLREANVIVFYLGIEDVNERLITAFQENIRAGGRIITVNVAIPGLEPRKTIRLSEADNDYVLYRYS